MESVIKSSLQASQLIKCQTSKCPELRSKIDKMYDELKALSAEVENTSKNMITELLTAKRTNTPEEYEKIRKQLIEKYKKIFKPLHVKINKQSDKILSSKHNKKLQECSYDNCYDDIAHDLTISIKLMDQVCEMVKETEKKREQQPMKKKLTKKQKALDNLPCDMAKYLSDSHAKMTSTTSKLTKKEYMTMNKRLIDMSKKMKQSLASK